MKRQALIVSFLIGGVAVSASAHDLFLKFDTYFLPPRARVVVGLLSGTFQTSENTIDRHRMQDVSLITPTGRIRPPMSDWRDQGQTTLLDFHTREPGTYIVGVALEPREIELKAADFNAYLEHDGIPDILAERRKNNQLHQDVRERYSKYAKAIFQVGEPRTANFQTRLGYPVEIIPRQNPYALTVGQTIELLCLKEGKPIANQFVMAGWETDGRLSPPLHTRSDGRGIARVTLQAAGKWYIKFIHMTPVKDSRVNYESQWATLTFEIR